MSLDPTRQHKALAAVLPQGQRAPALTTGKSAAVRRLLRFVGRHLDLLVAGFLLVAFTNIAHLFSSPTNVARLNFLDDSWAFDLIVRARHHDWLGRHVTFTFGPLFQMGVSAVPNLLGGSLGAYFRSWHVFPFWSGIVLTFLTGRLLLAWHTAWKRSFYLFALVGFWSALDIRFCFDVFVLAMALRHFDQVQESKNVRAWPALGLGALLLVGTLISADTGLYSVLAFLIAATTHIFMYRKNSAMRSILVKSAALSAVCCLGLALLLTALIVNPGFWRDSLQAVSTYRWALPYSMDKPVKWRLIAAGTFAILVLLLGSRWKDPLARSLCRKPVFFPAAIAFSLLTLQSAIVRADWGHVAIALLPSFALSGAVLMGGEEAPHWSWRADLSLLLALGLTALFSGPHPWLRPQSVVAGVTPSSIHKSQACQQRSFYLDGACLSRSDYEPLDAVSDYLRKETSASEPVAIFPFENIYADLADRRVAGGVLQNYQVAGERLASRQLQGLARDSPALAVFSADGVATLGVDGVPNVTRTPEVWFYLQSHFATQAEIAPGIIALRRDDARRLSWRQEATRVADPLQSGVRLKQPITVPLNYWPGDADFLKLRMTINYPMWWKVRKPARIIINLVHADGTSKSLRAVAPPNMVCDLWIYPWEEAQLMNYFDSSEGGWTKGRPRSGVTAVQVTIERIDWLSVVPSSVKVQSIEAVRLRLEKLGFPP